MTPTELMLGSLGVLMLAACGLIWYRLRNHARLAAWAVLGTVILFMLSAHELGLLA